MADKLSVKAQAVLTMACFATRSGYQDGPLYGVYGTLTEAALRHDSPAAYLRNKTRGALTGALNLLERLIEDHRSGGKAEAEAAYYLCTFALDILEAKTVIERDDAIAGAEAMCRDVFGTVIDLRLPTMQAWRSSVDVEPDAPPKRSRASSAMATLSMFAVTTPGDPAGPLDAVRAVLQDAALYFDSPDTLMSYRATGGLDGALHVITTMIDPNDTEACAAHDLCVSALMIAEAETADEREDALEAAEEMCRTVFGAVVDLRCEDPLQTFRDGLEAMMERGVTH